MYDAKTVATVLDTKQRGATHEEAAQAAGVSVRTVANMLDRVGRTKKRKHKPKKGR